MRGQLPNERILEISNILPKLDSKLYRVTYPGTGLGMQIHDFINNSKVGISLVGLDDARSRLQQVINSLHESYACRIWHKEYSDKEHREIASIATCKYYVDYAALLLYAVAEDIAFFITHFLNIEDELTEYIKDSKNAGKLKRRGVSSNAATIGIFLSDKYEKHAITKAILELAQNKYWKETINYRNTWVHDKPPIVDGLGIQYNRQDLRVKLEDGTERMYIGSGSPSQYNIDDLQRIVTEATTSVANLFHILLQQVKEYREQLGEVFDLETGRISIKFHVQPDEGQDKSTDSS